MRQPRLTRPRGPQATPRGTPASHQQDAQQKVPCPRRQPGSKPCGYLEPSNGSRVREATRYICSYCGRLWSARDVRALALAAARPPPGPPEVQGRQLGLPLDDPSG